jgi:hypothetical protein
VGQRNRLAAAVCCATSCSKFNSENIWGIRETLCYEQGRLQRCSARQVNTAISLAFLGPNLVEASVEGGLPRGIGIERLRDLPTVWNRQRLSDLLPNSVSAKPSIRAAYPALRFHAQRQPPGSEFCGPETERPERLLKRLDARRDNNPENR